MCGRRDIIVANCGRGRDMPWSGVRGGEVECGGQEEGERES